MAGVAGVDGNLSKALPGSVQREGAGQDGSQDQTTEDPSNKEVEVDRSMVNPSVLSRVSSMREVSVFTF